MRVFRRVQERVAPAGRQPDALNLRLGESATVERYQEDDRPVLVAVGSHHGRWDAVEWAAAEAAARGSALRIVHVVKTPPPFWDLNGTFQTLSPPDAVQAAAESVLRQAESCARRVVPDLDVTTQVLEGGTVTAILRQQGRHSLVVVGCGRRSRRYRLLVRSVTRQVAGRAHCPVAVVDLSAAAPIDRSAISVVVGLDGQGDPTAPLAVALSAAQRRGLAVIALQAWTPQDFADDSSDAAALTGAWSRTIWLEEALHRCHRAFPDVELRQRYLGSSAGRMVAAESAASALVVIGAQPTGRLRRALFGSVRRRVLHSARRPVFIVETSSERRYLADRGRARS